MGYGPYKSPATFVILIYSLDFSEHIKVSKYEHIAILCLEVYVK